MTQRGHVCRIDPKCNATYAREADRDTHEREDHEWTEASVTALTNSALGVFNERYERCNGPTGKLRYPTKEIAAEELSRFAYAKGSRRIHRCVFCDGYHLTKGSRGNRKGKP